MEQKRSPFVRWMKAHHPRAYYTVRNRAHGMGGHGGGIIKRIERGDWTIYLWRPTGWRYWRLMRGCDWNHKGLYRLHVQMSFVEAYWQRGRAEAFKRAADA